MIRHTDIPTIDLEHVLGGTKFVKSPTPDTSPDGADGTLKKPSGGDKKKDFPILL